VIAKPELIGSMGAIISGISCLIQSKTGITRQEAGITGYHLSLGHIVGPLR